MRDRSEGGVPPPLPWEWLPDPQPPEGAEPWDTRLERIMAAADPGLRGLRTRSAAAGTSWSVFGLWWKPAAALAAAAIALPLLIGPPTVSEPRTEGLSLSLIAAEGDPVTLWGAFGIPADPVLARIAFQGQRNRAGQGVTPVKLERENR
ncbi:MAG: hypothetical protein GEU90_19550 [Gemmatimonas sp.]|nr:hypothetical protein [Gemmatimonas sp.]